MSNCPFCHPHLDPSQRIVAENDSCYFLMHDGEQDVLVGSGVIVPKQHRATTFELTPTEWCDTYTLLHDAKSFLEKRTVQMAIRSAGMSVQPLIRPSLMLTCTSFRATQADHMPGKAYVIG